MKKNLVLGCSLVSLVLLSGFLGFGKKDPIVAKVGKEKITLEDYNARLSTINPAQINDQVRAGVLNDMVAEKLILIEAKKEGIPKTDEFKEQLNVVYNRLLSETLLRDQVYSKINVLW